MTDQPYKEISKFVFYRDISTLSHSKIFFMTSIKCTYDTFSGIGLFITSFNLLIKKILH